MKSAIYFNKQKFKIYEWFHWWLLICKIILFAYVCIFVYFMNLTYNNIYKYQKDN
jgi:hypothetical protein